MQKNSVYETEAERFRRERADAIVKEYLEKSREILLGEVTPNRVVNYLAERFCMSGYGVKTVLKRMGVYKNAQQPVIIPKDYTPQQIVMQSSIEGKTTTHI